MPIPKPRKGESDKDFLSRCMADDVMVKEYPDRKQRYAICHSQLKKREKGETFMAFTHNSKTASSEPGWGTVDKTALPRIAHADMGEEGKKSTWKYPHHWVKGGTKKDEDGIWTDGTLYLHHGGLKAAWAAANGARSGKKASQAVINHLQAHRNTVKSSAAGALASDPWLIEPSWLQTMYDIVMRNGDPDALSVKQGEVVEGVERRGTTAVVNVIGPIFRYANLFTEISGATSTGKLASDITKAVEDDTIERVVLSFDSPGGQVTGINELAKLIREGSEKKPIIAYVGGSAASAAYWLASAASEVVADETALIGSIGVVATFQRNSDDTIEIVSSNAPRKRPDITTQEGKDEVRKTLDAIADVFVEAVAENRGVEKDYVLENFGQGGILVGKAALSAGMIDKIDSFENTLKGGNKMEVTRELLVEKNPDLLNEIAEEARREALKEASEEITKLKVQMFRKDLEAQVGPDITEKLMPLFTNVDKEVIDSITAEFVRLQNVINTLGEQKGDGEVKPVKTDEPDMEAVKKIADEQGISMTDALVEYEKQRRE